MAAKYIYKTQVLSTLINCTHLLVLSTRWKMYFGKYSLEYLAIIKNILKNETYQYMHLNREVSWTENLMFSVVSVHSPPSKSTNTETNIRENL